LRNDFLAKEKVKRDRLISDIEDIVKVPPSTSSNSNDILCTKHVESQKSRAICEDKAYDTCEETRPINVADGFVIFVKHFKYLGSYISYNLRDDYDVHIRITTAYKAMGALHSFWKCNEIEKYSKYLLFLAIPVNLALWGYKSWALKDSLIHALNIFLHRSLRRILGITMLI